MSDLVLDKTKIIYHIDRLLAWKQKEQVAPIHVEVSPTDACNYRCFFCFFNYNPERKRSLSREVYLTLIKDMKKIGVRSCLLAGDGEPLCHPSTPEAIEVAGKAGLSIALNTNGFLMKPEVSQKTLKHLEWLRFSIMSSDSDLYSQLHGTNDKALEKVLNNIQKCVEIKRSSKLKVTIGIQQVLISQNANNIFNLASISRNLGVDYFVLKPFSKHPNNEYDVSTNLFREVRDELMRAESLSTPHFKSIIRWNAFDGEGKRDYKGCPGLPFIYQISGDGGVYACAPFFGNPEFCYGNLNEVSFIDIVKSSEVQKKIRKISVNVDSSKCMTCCRHHTINKFLWNLMNPPDHLNFI